MVWMLLKILLGLLAIRVVYFVVWYELRRRRRLRTGTWQLDCLKDQCVNGVLLEEGSYLIDEEGDDGGYSCEPWGNQCRSLLAQLSPAQLDEVRQAFIDADRPWSEQRLIDGVIISYLAPMEIDIQQVPPGRFWKWTNGWASLGHDRNKIKCPPGSRLRAFAQWVYCKKTYERVFEQQIADMQLEHIEALAEHDLWKARWVHVRGVVGFWTTVVVHANVKLITAVVGVVRATFGI